MSKYFFIFCIFLCKSYILCINEIDSYDKKMLNECTHTITQKAHKKKAVTYTFSGGRFGDNIVSYMHGLWYSYKYNIPLLYKPFPYSDQLVLHEKHEMFDNISVGQFLHQQELGGKYTIDSFNDLSTLYVWAWYPKNPINELDKPKWSDPEFKAILRKNIAPRRPIKLIQRPKDRISVALHIRTGGDFEDMANVIMGGELRFPSEQFFIDQIDRLYNAFNCEPMYVHIFTDDSNPIIIMKRFEKNFSGKNIIFNCRTEGNRHNNNVLEDYFSFAEFDCFIHSISTFALTAAELFDFMVEIKPIDFIWDSGKVHVTKVSTKVNLALFPENFYKCAQNLTQKIV